MKAGFGISKLTPRSGVEMAGFGPWLHRYAIGIREDLEARAVALQTEEGQRVVIVACDLISLPQTIVSKVRQIIQEQAPNLPETAIFVSAIHTHSGPAIRDFKGWGGADSPYVRTLPRRIATAALNALASLKDVRFQVLRESCKGIGFNRMHEKRTPEPEEVFQPDWQPDHPEQTDTEATVAGFFDVTTGNLAGFLVNFGCHPVSCCGENQFLHGDYPAVAMHKVMAKHPGSVGVFLQGAHGDVVTGLVHQPKEIANRALECFATRLASSVENALGRMDSLSSAVPLKFANLEMQCAVAPEFTLDFLKKTLEEQQDFLSKCEDDTRESTRMAAVYCDGAEDLIARYGESGIPSCVTAVLHGIRIGELLLLGAPFEMMQGIRREVCGNLSAAFPCLVSLCGDALGYAPDRESAEQAKLYESKLVPLINGLLPYGNIWNELPESLCRLANILGTESENNLKENHVYTGN